MAVTSAIQIQADKFSSLGFSKTIVNKEQVACYSRSLGSASDDNPVIVLIHGYPQSAYEYIATAHLKNHTHANLYTGGAI
jgi:C-terminal processing protease CtpA/Prc